jgi:iron(III) transport system ATP-binding protein
MSRLWLRDLVVGYESGTVLRGVSLDVPHGALVAIVGPSGCGKTTLLRTIAGLMRARSGEIRLNLRMVTTHGIHLAPEKRRIGWVPQDAALFPHLTVAENIAFGLGGGRRAARRAAREDRVAHLLELVGLSALADRTPAQLSGGQAQRVALARALAAKPEVVLLDEPFGALDPLLRGELRAEVRALLTAEGTTGILVTHDQAEALSIADYVAVMNDGEILQFGRPEEVYERPATPWVASFVGDSVFLPAVWHAGTVEGGLGSLSAEWMPASGALSEAMPEDGTSVTVLVRPEQIELTPGDAGSGFWATVTAVSYTGHDALLELLLGNGVRCTSRVPASGLLPVGARVTATVRGPVLAYPLAPE